MDKNKAIKLLKQYVTEIPKLRELHYDNQEFKLWQARVGTIIKEGLAADDYERLCFVQEKYFLEEFAISELSLMEDYLPKLNDYETLLNSIIQKYEILGIEEEGDKRGEVEKMDNQTLEKTKEIEIQGDSLEKLYPIITMVTSELRFRNFFYEARLATSNVTDSYAGFAVFTIDPSNMSKTPIGAFTLLLLGSNRITLRVPPRSRWHHDFNLTPLEIIKLGLIKEDENAKKSYDEQFNQFIKSLEDRLTHYSLKITLPKRLWRGFEKLIGIYKAVKL